MKSIFASLKLIGLLSVFVCGQAFSQVYLACVNSKRVAEADPYARLQPFTDPFLKSYATGKNFGTEGPNANSKQFINIDNRFILKGEANATRILLANNATDDKFSYMIFGNLEEAQDFCKELAQVCQETFPDPVKKYPYAVGTQDSQVFLDIGIFYHSEHLGQFFCPSSDQEH